MTARSCTTSASKASLQEQHPRLAAQTQPRGVTARLAAAIAIVTVIALCATGCGRHFHITYHAGGQPGAARLSG